MWVDEVRETSLRKVSMYMCLSCTYLPLDFWDSERGEAQREMWQGQGKIMIKIDRG